MVIGSRNSMRNGDSDAFLAANKYPTGAEGLFALHKDAKETLGELGFAVFTDELNQQDAANNAANGQAAGAGAQGYNYGTGMNDGGVEYPPEPSPEPMPQPPPVPNDHPDLEDYEAEAGKYWDEHDAWEDEVEKLNGVVQEAEEAAQEANKRKVQGDVIDTLKRIVESDEIEDDTFKNDVHKVLGFLETSGISGDPGTYVFDLDGRTAEVEVLETRRINRFGGEGAIDQDIFEQIISAMLGSVGTALDSLKALGTTIDSDFNPGVLLEPGDVRIRIGTTVESEFGGNSAGTGLDYFFKDGKLLYAENFGQVIWGEYGNELMTEYRESGKIWLDVIKDFPIVDTIKSLKN